MPQGFADKVTGNQALHQSTKDKTQEEDRVVQSIESWHYFVGLFAAVMASGIINSMMGTFRTKLTQLTVLGFASFVFGLFFYTKMTEQWYVITTYSLLGLAFIWELIEFIALVGRKKRQGDYFKQLSKGRGPYLEIIRACDLIRSASKGALIIIENTTALDAWSEKGIRHDAVINADLIASIFISPTALHDGAVIIKEDRIVSSCVIVPLSHSVAIPHELGTRHRAALGISARTDAVVIVVSEETGEISLAHKDKLYHGLPINSLPKVLAKVARGHKIKKEAYIPAD